MLESIQLFREVTLVPIVIASTDSVGTKYRIAGFDIGADEVWEIPEHIEVAVAKRNAIIRRYFNLFKEIDNTSTIIVNKHLVLSETQRIIFVKGNKVELTKTEFDILVLLLSHPGGVHSYELIFCEVWGEDYMDYDKEVLRNQIYKLRDKLKVDPTVPNYIKTHQGIGYSFTPEYDT